MMLQYLGERHLRHCLRRLVPDAGVLRLRVRGVNDEEVSLCLLVGDMERDFGLWQRLLTNCTDSFDSPEIMIKYKYNFMSTYNRFNSRLTLANHP